MKKDLYKKIMAFTLAIIPMAMLNACGNNSTGTANTENSSIFESISSAEETDSKDSNEENSSVEENTSESSDEETAPTSRKDGERFEDTIMLEGMDETVNYEHAINDALGFEIDFEYESLMRKSDSESEKFISIYDDPENPDNYLEITYTPEVSDTVVESVKADLSDNYDYIEDTDTLDGTGDCTVFYTTGSKGNAESSSKLQAIYIIPSGEGSLVGTAHYTYESAEGFGHRFSYMMNTLKIN